MEHLNTGDCGRIGSHLLILYAHLLLTGKPAPTRPIVKTRSLEQIGKLSSMILRYVNLVMTICSQKSFTLNHPISSEYQSLSRNSRFLCVSPHLKHNLSAVEKKYISARYTMALSPIECLNGLGSAMLQKLPTKRKEVIC